MAFMMVLGVAPAAQAAAPAERQFPAPEVFVQVDGSLGPGEVSGPGNGGTYVVIPGGRRLFLTCRGTGSPTVVSRREQRRSRGCLEDEAVRTRPGRPASCSRFTRVCAYDRPGYDPPDGRRSRSDLVAMPRSAQDIVGDLRDCSRQPGSPGPYVLVGHSFGGMVARLYATTHPTGVVGLVSIDAQSENFAAAYKGSADP